MKDYKGILNDLVANKRAEAERKAAEEAAIKEDKRRRRANSHRPMREFLAQLGQDPRVTIKYRYVESEFSPDIVSVAPSKFIKVWHNNIEISRGSGGPYFDEHRGTVAELIPVILDKLAEWLA